jgi:hypothetical protein
VLVTTADVATRRPYTGFRSGRVTNLSEETGWKLVEYVDWNGDARGASPSQSLLSPD